LLLLIFGVAFRLLLIFLLLVLAAGATAALLVAILVALPKPTTCRPATRAGVVGGALAYFAVGCPTCNHLVVLAIGASGALQWFAPLQPILALAGIVVLLAAIIHRLRLLRRDGGLPAYSASSTTR